MSVTAAKNGRDVAGILPVAAADFPSSPKPIADPILSSTTSAAAHEDTMIFSDFYKGSRSPLARLRNGNPQLPAKLATNSPDWVGDEYADLLSKDKAKNKEAVRRYLADKVRDDWGFDWPTQQVAESSAKPAQQEEDQSAGLETAKADDTAAETTADSSATDDGYQVEDTELDSDDESVYSVVSADNLHWRARAEWTSDIDEDDDSSSLDDSQSSLQLANDRRARRRRAIREETSWNAGLACFEARRNAWTGAKTVRVRSKPVATTPVQPISPRSPRRFFFRRSMSSSPPSAAAALAAAHAAASADLSGTASDSSSIPHDELRKVDSHADGSTANTPATSTEETRTYPVETLLPLAQPILPPSNPLRASITPNVYLALYDKVILHNLQPSCPINLGDMLRSCVTGWKRDGEWPPRSTPYNPPPAAKKKKSPPNKPKKPAAPTAAAAAQATEAPEAKASRRLSFNLLNRDADESRAGKGFRKSLQRALGMGPLPGFGETA